ARRKENGPIIVLGALSRRRESTGKPGGLPVDGKAWAMPGRRIAQRIKVVQGINAMLHKEEKDEDLDDFNDLRNLFNGDRVCRNNSLSRRPRCYQ
ncbi:MAG: hypothetical protein OXF19_03485, partial [Hyphomicrobiales bacterium]|nr:hypothetical protein [Hyphomicrobiales bacterium]